MVNQHGHHAIVIGIPCDWLHTLYNLVNFDPILYIYIYIKVRMLRANRDACARRIRKDSQSKPRRINLKNWYKKRRGRTTSGEENYIQ